MERYSENAGARDNGEERKYQPGITEVPPHGSREQRKAQQRKKDEAGICEENDREQQVSPSAVTFKEEGVGDNAGRHYQCERAGMEFRHLAIRPPSRSMHGQGRCALSRNFHLQQRRLRMANGAPDEIYPLEL